MKPGTTLGLVIQTRRQEIGLSSAALAREIRLNKSTILRMERGEIATPAPDTLIRLARALDLPAPELFALAGHPLPSLREYLQAAYGPLSETVIHNIERILNQARTTS